MKNSISTRLIARLLLGCAFATVLLLAPALKAAGDATLQPLSGQAATLPLTTAFEKNPSGESGPYVLKLTNTSKDSLKVSVKVLLSVAFHADNKARHLPDQAIEAGKTITIPDLAANDKVVISAAEYAPMTITVP